MTDASGISKRLSRPRQQAPGIRVAIRPVEGTRIQEQFEQGNLDPALMTPESAPSDLHARRLFDERYVCAIRGDHPDALAGSISIDRFCTLDHALVSYTGERFWGVTDDALTRIGRQRRVVLTVTNFLVLAEVLRTTDLIAIVPKRLVSDAEDLAVLEPPVEIPGSPRSLCGTNARTTIPVIVGLVHS